MQMGPWTKLAILLWKTAHFSKVWAKCGLRASVCCLEDLCLFELLLYFPVCSHGHVGTLLPLSVGFSIWVLILETNAPLLAVSEGRSGNTIENLGNIYFRKLKYLKVLGALVMWVTGGQKGSKCTLVHQGNPCLWDYYPTQGCHDTQNVFQNIMTKQVNN